MSRKSEIENLAARVQELTKEVSRLRATAKPLPWRPPARPADAITPEEAPGLFGPLKALLATL